MDEARLAMVEFLEENEYNWEEITCDGCPVVDDCVFAYDIYNTDGDCLALK